MFGFISEYIASHKRRKEWLSRNTHNKTSMGTLFEPSLVSVGNATYGEITVINYSNSYKLIIGHFCSIAPEVLFVVCGDHKTDSLTTFPLKVRYQFQKFEALSKGDIIVEDDVWIGTRVTILSGVRIGRGAVISAGSLVVKDVPPYTIVGGVPAKVLKRRFEDPVVNKLLKIDFSKIDDRIIKSNIDLFYETINQDTDLSWLPLKEEGTK